MIMLIIKLKINYSSLIVSYQYIDKNKIKINTCMYIIRLIDN